MAIQKQHFVKFATVIDGQTAAVDVPVGPNIKHSRGARKLAENIARQSFAKLSDRFNPSQKIHAVDLFWTVTGQADGEQIIETGTIQ